jgi:hypothetical protein
VECKAPRIALDEKFADQMTRYLTVIPEKMILATNGKRMILSALQE